MTNDDSHKGFLVSEKVVYALYHLSQNKHIIPYIQRNNDFVGQGLNIIIRGLLLVPIN